jgi:uncharacterized membrane protein
MSMVEKFLHWPTDRFTIFGASIPARLFCLFVLLQLLLMALILQFRSIVFSFPTVIWYLFVLLQFLLLCPILMFWSIGWNRRKREILDCLSPTARLYYMRAFHASEIEHVAEGSPKETEQASKAFESYYDLQFGRRRMVLPVLLLLALSIGLLYPTARSAIDWHSGNTLDNGFLPISVVLAILGGYTWVVFDLTRRMTRDHIGVSDSLWCCFRLVVAVPLGYSFGMMFTKDAALPIAYLMGTLPTSDILNVARRVFLKASQGKEPTDTTLTDIQKLPSVDS